MLKYKLIDSELLENQIYDFCKDNLLSDLNFGLQCQIYQFIKKKEFESFSKGLIKKINPEKLKTLRSVTQTI